MVDWAQPTYTCISRLLSLESLQTQSITLQRSRCSGLAKRLIGLTFDDGGAGVVSSQQSQANHRLQRGTMRPCRHGGLLLECSQDCIETVNARSQDSSKWRPEDRPSFQMGRRLPREVNNGIQHARGCLDYGHEPEYDPMHPGRR